VIFYELAYYRRTMKIYVSIETTKLRAAYNKHIDNTEDKAGNP
jgi:LEA14-like dessication related protein